MPREVEIQVTVTPVDPTSTDYEFSVRNNGPHVLSCLKVHTGGVLSPGDFGLDDTHMPAEMAWRPSIHIARLAPSEERTVVQHCSGRLLNYGGKRSLLVPVEFSVEGAEADSPAKCSAQVTVVGPPSRIPFRLCPVPPRLLLRSLLPVILLGILGVLALVLLATGKHAA